MMQKIDADGKVTISLGGKCTLGCKHCYTNTTTFSHQARMSPREAMIELAHLKEYGFSTICVSGDTDCFLNPTLGIDFLERIVENYTTETIMFTTRLIPPESVVSSIIKLGAKCRKRDQLFIPCISLVSFNYPNAIENFKRVPSSLARLNFLNFLYDNGLLCFLALRPTFPFSLIPFDEVENIIKFVNNRPIVVLGEVLLLDVEDEIKNKLSIEQSLADCEESKLTFIEQASIYKKLFMANESARIKQLCNSYGLPYFLRSITGVDYLKKVNALGMGWVHNPILFDGEETNIYP